MKTTYQLRTHTGQVFTLGATCVRDALVRVREHTSESILWVRPC